MDLAAGTSRGRPDPRRGGATGSRGGWIQGRESSRQRDELKRKRPRLLQQNDGEAEKLAAARHEDKKGTGGGARSSPAGGEDDAEATRGRR